MAGSKVTTKKGDKGQTRTIAGDIHSKTHPILECCGRLDELRAQTALLRLEVIEHEHEEAGEIASILYWILHVYFLIGTECNDPHAKKPEYRYQSVSRRHLERLEDYQAYLEDLVVLSKDFIVSAADPMAARFDVLCTVARTFERSVVALQEAVPEFDAEHILAFTNRLSDFFFVVARLFDDGRSLPVNYSVLD